jgi:hypothetical protein
MCLQFHAVVSAAAAKSTEIVAKCTMSFPSSVFGRFLAAVAFVVIENLREMQFCRYIPASPS